MFETLLLGVGEGAREERADRRASMSSKRPPNLDVSAQISCDQWKTTKSLESYLGWTPKGRLRSLSAASLPLYEEAKQKTGGTPSAIDYQTLPSGGWH